MASKNFYFRIIFRVFFITLTSFAFAFVVLKEHIDYGIYLFVFLVFQVIGLIIFLNKTNRKIAFFFNAVENDDSAINFPVHIKDKSIRDLHESLNQVNFLIQKIKIENRQQEQYYHSVLEQAEVGLLTLNDKGHILLANNTAKKLLNYNALTHIQQLKRVDEKLFRLVSSLKPIDQKMIALTNERETIQLTIRSKPITIGNENLILLIIQNINRELDEKETEAWIKLFRVLTHEIMNSIAPITSLSETLTAIYEKNSAKKNQPELSEQDIANTIKGLNVINHQGKNLIDFVESYRTLTKISKPEKEIVLVETLFNKIRILSSQEKGFHNIKFEAAVTPKDLEIYADEKQIIQVLLNLIKNAIQSINTNENLRGLVQLKAKKDENGRIDIAVIDNGKGIDKEIQDQIFIPFFTTKKEGTGIGLSLSRHIMRLHGGSIHVSSVPNQTTTFSLKF